MKKIKVLHFFGKMDIGGAETFVMNLYRQIDRNKVQFEFAVTSPEKGHFDDEIKELGGKIHILPHPKQELRKYIQRLKLLLATNVYDVIHSHVHYFSGINLSIGKKCGVKIRISHSHTYNNNDFSFKRFLYEYLMKSLIKLNATHLLACSREAAKELFDNKRVEIINNGIDLERFTRTKYSKEEYRKALNIPEKSFVIGHIGGFRPEKNHSKLIDIFLDVLKEESNAHLVMVGDGEKRIDIEKLVDDYKIRDKVHFLGIRKDTEDILRSFDIFVFPSLYEGLGIAVIEAQVSGLYCVVSDTLPKAVDITGNVSYIALDAEKEWVDAILNNYYNKKSINTELIEYDIRNVCKQIFNLYRG